MNFNDVWVSTKPVCVVVVLDAVELLPNIHGDWSSNCSLEIAITSYYRFRSSKIIRHPDGTLIRLSFVLICHLLGTSERILYCDPTGTGILLLYEVKVS